MLPKLNWAQIIAVVSGLAGVVGSVVTPIWGAALAGEVQAVIQAVSGILVILAGGSATAVAHSTAMAKLGIVKTHVLEVQK